MTPTRRGADAPTSTPPTTGTTERRHPVTNNDSTDTLADQIAEFEQRLLRAITSFEASDEREVRIGTAIGVRYALDLLRLVTDGAYGADRGDDR